MIAIRKKIHFFLGFLVCLLLIASQSAITIPEGHNALLLHAGNLVANAQGRHVVLKPGLHFKIPFLVQDLLLDYRLQTLTFQESSSTTLQGKPLVIDYYANWRISDPVRYYQQTKNNLQQTNLLLTQQINSLFQQDHANSTFSDIIMHGPATQLYSAISKANKQLNIAGINIVDIGFKQLQLSAAANTSLLKNMNTEQENIAIAQRANGQANAEVIHANADNSVHLILAKATEEAAQIRGLGDAEAAKIYNQAYHKNPEFAAFYLNLRTYQQGFNQSSSMNNFLLFNTNDDAFNSFEKAQQAVNHQFKRKA